MNTLKSTQHASLARFALLALGVMSVLSLGAPGLAAQDGRAANAYNLGEGKLALQGYDPVAYFEVGGAMPKKGREDISLEYEGVVYRFANMENRKLFEASPLTYEPAFGGWCAYAMSKNKKVKVDPEAFRIGEGRLLLFVDKDYVQFDDDWVPEEHKLLTQADKNWKAMTGESARIAPAGSWRPINEWNLSGDSLALQGYDPVSYFPEGGGKPAKGNAKYELRHGGVLYRFANEANEKAFAANPDKYEPQHGGWCSYAMGAKGKKVEVEPDNYRLTNGQLHLFYTFWFGNTADDWDEDTANLKRNADANWAKMEEAAAPES